MQILLVLHGKYSYDMALNMQLDTAASIAERHTNDMFPK
jgi:hypothetical protein